MHNFDRILSLSLFLRFLPIVYSCGVSWFLPHLTLSFWFCDMKTLSYDELRCLPFVADFIMDCFVAFSPRFSFYFSFYTCISCHTFSFFLIFSFLTHNIYPFTWKTFFPLLPLFLQIPFFRSASLFFSIDYRAR